MTAEAAILDGLFRQLTTPTLFSPALPISWPDKTFEAVDPVPSAYWLRATLLRADTFSASIGAGANRYSGQLQIDVLALAGTGLKKREDTAGIVAARFNRNTPIISRDFRIQISQPPSLLPLQKDDPWAFIPVRIPWVCYASNPA